MEGPAAADHGAHDGTATARARLAGTVVDLELSLHAPLTAARLLLSRAARTTIANALHLMGVAAPDRM